MVNNSEIKKKSPEAEKAEMLMVGCGVAAVLFYINRELIFYEYETNCEKVFFAVWLFILFFVYKRLKSNLKASASERKNILKMIALRPKPLPVNPNWSRSLPDKTQIPIQTKHAEEIKIGTRLKDGRKMYLSDDKRTTHVQILGATGRGKTESVIIPWMVQDYGENNHSVILIDGKGDPEIAKRFREYVDYGANKPDIYEFDPSSFRTCVLNPLKWGTPLQITDRIISSFEFPDPYYKAVQSEGLLSVVTLLSNAREEITFRSIDKVLRDMEYLSELSRKSPHQALNLKVRAILSLKEQERMSQFSGLLSQLSPFVTGEIADLVNGAGDTCYREMSLSEILLNQDPATPKAALILIPTLMYPEAGRVLGKMCLQEVAYCVGVRSSQGTSNRFTSVFLDEFSSYAYPGFEQILNKARSAKVALHLSHQSTGDLEQVSPEFAKVVNTNTNIKCLLGLNDPDTADFFARHIGTETKSKFTERVEEANSLFGNSDERTGQKSMREAEVYRIHPNRLKNLNAGEGVIHVPGKPDALTEEIQFHDLNSLGLIPKRQRPECQNA